MSGPVRFAVVGDTTLDVTVEGVTPAAGSDRPAAIETGPGGQGANVAVRLARGGADVRLLTAIGSDPAGRLLTAMLDADGISLVNLESVSSGIVVSLVDGTGERAMLSDRASLDPDRIEASVSEVLRDVDWVHVSGYPLDDPASGDVLAAALSRRAVVRCSIGGGSFGDGLAIGTRIRLARPEIVQFDRAEAAALLAEQPDAADARSAEALASALATTLGVAAIVTDGVAGAAAATSGGAFTVVGPALPTRDATGAGDAHAASVLLHLASGSGPPTLDDLRGALEDAAATGAEVAATIGAQARIPSEGAR